MAALILPSVCCVISSVKKVVWQQLPKLRCLKIKQRKGAVFLWADEAQNSFLGTGLFMAGVQHPDNITQMFFRGGQVRSVEIVLRLQNIDPLKTAGFNKVTDFTRTLKMKTKGAARHDFQ